MSYFPLGNVTKVSATNQTTTVTGGGVILDVWSSTTANDLNTFTVTVDGNTIISSISGGGATIILQRSRTATSGFAMVDSASVSGVNIPFKVSFSIISLRAANTINANYVS